MSEKQPKTSRPTLENLFELKRCERPTEDFWNQWDARLREKQLAALIPVASPWSRFATLFGRLAKVGVPVTAVAAVAIGFVVLNQDRWRSHDSPARSQGEVGVATAGTRVADLDAHALPENQTGIKTVVIDAAPSVVAAVSDSTPRTSSPSSDQLARTLPWLTTASTTKAATRLDIEAPTSLQVDGSPTALALAAFEESKREVSPVWAPTEQHLREAVASEIGIGSAAFADRKQTGWITRVVAANPRSRYMESRIDSEDYPRELSRVGVTASTLSFKF